MAEYTTVDAQFDKCVEYTEVMTVASNIPGGADREATRLLRLGYVIVDTHVVREELVRDPGIGTPRQVRFATIYIMALPKNRG